MLIPALRRCGLSFLILLLVSVVVFAATEILPGDALEVSLTTDEIAMMSAEQLDAKRAALGLDRPAHVRYAEWLGGMLTGNFGTTLIDRTPVAQRIVDPIRNSILLGIAATLAAIPVALAIGIAAAYWRGRAPDAIASVGAIVGYSIPEFVSGTVLVVAFAVWLPVFPAIIVAFTDAPAWDLLAVSVLPILTIVIGSIAHLSRLLRVGMIEALGSEFVERARLSGLPEWRIVLVHALPAALLPTMNAIALYVAGLLNGIIVVEKVFGYPGLGTELIEAVTKRDVPTVQAITFLGAAVVIVMNLLADLSIYALDPRIRRQAG